MKSLILAILIGASMAGIQVTGASDFDGHDVANPMTTPTSLIRQTLVLPPTASTPLSTPGSNSALTLSASWTAVVPGVNLRKVFADPGDLQHLYAYGIRTEQQRGYEIYTVYASQDGGGSWIVASEPSAMYEPSFAIAANGAIFAASPAGRILKSIDRGRYLGGGPRGVS